MDNKKSTNKADATMVLDIVESLLTLSSNLQDSGVWLTNTLWELTGAYAIFLMVDSGVGYGKQRIISVTPERKFNLIDHILIDQFSTKARGLKKVTFLSSSDNQNADLRWNIGCGGPIENAIVAPFCVADEYLGCLLILELPPDDIGRPTMLKAIETLTNILSLVIRNSLLHEKQEEIISLRTNELRQMNHKLEEENNKRKEAEALLQNYNVRLEQEIQNQTEELRQKNILLEKEISEKIRAEEELRNTTVQLIQTEKLVSIGQLAAGVAHEVNNPLGAIGSSNSSIKECFKYIAENHNMQNDLMTRYKAIIAELIANIENDTHTYSSREIRQHKKDIVANLTAKELNEPEKIAEYLTSLGIYTDYDNFIPLLTDDKYPEVHKFLYCISSVIKGSKIIDLAVNQSSRVVLALKDFARSDEYTEIAPTNVKETIDTALILYGNVVKHGIEMKTELNAVPLINGYPHKLCQVWSNLIQNAVQAMDNHGTLSITLRQIDNNICVTISDTGPGIPENMLKKIFDPLFTTKKPGEGTGLGLDIAKKIVLMHNGNIKVESKPGQGAVFTVSLPINPKQQPIIN
ncbi:MAG: GHKL domain-containing protein [Sedimentisphaerales bacterium]|nr:GHKL domain-containing protein [Sedimentisphaerales bacterium]